MVIVVLQMLAWLAFLAGTLTLGAWLRRNPSKSSAERASRVLHFLFWMGVVPPAAIGFFYPGPAGYDAVLGLSPLSGQSVVRLVGALGLLIGAYLIIVSNMALSYSGEGAGAFWLTKRLVTGTLYGRVRNPMSLGLYLACVGIGLLVGSTYMTLGALLVVIPFHVFYLKYFEEYELGVRLGPSYIAYQQRVPFLLPRWFPRKR
jgi:protein-S-isoprenylcysteine O-methyltransferase Ste14